MTTWMITYPPSEYWKPLPGSWKMTAGPWSWFLPASISSRLGWLRRGE